MGKPCQDSIAILAALEVKIVAEVTGQAGERGEFGGQVAAVGALHAVVHFFERDDVGLFRE